MMEQKQTADNNTMLYNNNNGNMLATTNLHNTASYRPDTNEAATTTSSGTSSEHQHQQQQFTPQTIKPLLRSRLQKYRNGNGRRASFEGGATKNYRSSLATIESAAASSIDIYDEDDSDSEFRGSQMSQLSAASASSKGRPRRHSIENGSVGSSHGYNNSSAKSLMVSFSRLNEAELVNLRKWNRRLHRTEVFDKYYFPAKWEANEMEALIGFLKLEDPYLKKASSVVGGMRGGSLRGSGKNNNPKRRGSNASSLRESITSSITSSSLRSSDTTGENRLRSSLTSSFNNSISKLLSDPKQTITDPAKLTKQAIDFIFFPYVHDPKSVLLKRGSVFLRNNGSLLSANETPSLQLSCNQDERELMIFTHGFVLANVVLEDAFSLFLALSDREFLTEKSFLDHLLNRFREMDVDDTGEIEKWELQKLFTDMGIPMGESVLDELLQRSGQSSEKIDWEALNTTLQGLFFQKNNESQTGKPGLDDSGSDRDGLEPQTGLKKFLGAFSKRKTTTKVEYACLFSNIACVDSLNICHGEDSISKEMADSAFAQTSFSITLNDRPNDPLIFVCSKPEHRDSWVEAFKPGLVRTMVKSSRSEMKDLRQKLGWQHLVIRSSFTSLAILDDAEALECACQYEDSEEGSSYRKLKLELNLLDEYNGYSPLHYATVLGHTTCMRVLLEAGAKVKLEDREGVSSMYHALSMRADAVADVLETFGADRNDDLKKLIAHEIHQEELKNNAAAGHTNGGRLETHAENGLGLDVSTSERSENLDDLLAAAANKFAW